ncbi:MAG: hypothetical protein WD096_02475 [Actinomycetota bacterium]
MNELKEIFDMVTKQTEPDLDSWKDQEDRQRRSARTKRIGAYTVAAVFVVLAAIAVVTQRDGDGGTGPADEPVSPSPVPTVVTHSYLDIATGTRTPVAADLTDARLAEVSPDGTSVVYSTCCSGADFIYVADLAGAERTQIDTGAPNGYAPTWIDDDTILVQARDADTRRIGDLYGVDVRTGDEELIVDLPDLRTGAWVVTSDVSPDGTTVLYHLPRGQGADATWDLWTAPIAGGEATLLRKDAGFAAYAPDGSIVFLDHPVPFESDAIWIMDGDGGDARSLVKGGVYTWPRVSPDGAMVAYGHDGKAEIVDIATGEVTGLDAFSEEFRLAWYSNDTLIVDM